MSSKIGVEEMFSPPSLRHTYNLMPRPKPLNLALNNIFNCRNFGFMAPVGHACLRVHSNTLRIHGEFVSPNQPSKFRSIAT